MDTVSQWRPGAYPTLYTCRYCGTVVKKKDIVAGRAKALTGSACICPSCVLEGREDRVNGGLSPQLSQKAEDARSASAVSGQAVADSPEFVVLIAAAEDDPALRKSLLTLTVLDSFNRQSLIGTMVHELALKKAPPALCAALASLADDDVAKRVTEVLLSRS